MEFDQVKRKLRLNVDFDLLKKDWVFSSSVPGSFLSLSRMEKDCLFLRMSQKVTEICLETARWISSSPFLKRLAWHCHYLLFQNPPGADTDYHLWPMLPPSSGKLSGMFYAVVLLTGVENVKALYRRLGIPEQILQKTLTDLELWIRHTHEQTGRWEFRQIGWLWRHFLAKIFLLGRLQFELSQWLWDFVVYRRMDNGRCLALAEETMRFREDGQFFDADGKQAEKFWVASREEDEKFIHGYPVHRKGKAVKRKVRLEKNKWQLFLQKGTPVLAVHIPAQGYFHGPLSPQACDDSFQQAYLFFPKYFPDFCFQAFTCVSWLLDSQLAQYLPDSSNIVSFQKRFYLLPLPGANDFQTMERVFGQRPTKLELAPKDTKLRQIILAHMEKGGFWRSSLGFIPRVK